MMKILSIFGILIISLILGLIVRAVIKKKPKVEVITWWLFVIFWSIFLIISLVLTLKADEPIFSKHNRANECFLISSIIFLGLGIVLLKKSINRSIEGDKEDVLKDKNNL